MTSQVSEVEELLADLPLLSPLSAELRGLVAESFAPCAAAFGTEVVRQGEPSDAFYVVLEGRARVFVTSLAGEEVTLETLERGDSFGEIGLLRGRARSATVRASTPLRLLRLDGAVFRALLARHPELRERVEDKVRLVRLRELLSARLSGPGLSGPVLERTAAATHWIEVPAGEPLLSRDVGDDVWLVEDGRLELCAAEPELEPQAFLRPGDLLTSQHFAAGAARAVAREASRILRIPGRAWDELLEAHPVLRRAWKRMLVELAEAKPGRRPLDFAEPARPAAEAPAPAPAEPGPPRRRRIRRLPHVRQIDESDCGAACLAMVCRHYGGEIPLARIRSSLGSGTDGASLEDLCRAAERLGLAARPAVVSKSQLEAMPLPAILHWDGNHWVVLYRLEGDWAWIADPASDLRRIPREELERRWTGYAALLDYSRDFAAGAEQRSGLRLLLPFARPFLGLLARAAGVALVASGLQMTLPVFTQIVVDRVLVDQDVGLLHTVVAAMGAALAFLVVSLFAQRYLVSFASVRIDAASLDFVVRRLLALPLGYFTARRTGDVQRRLESVRRVRDFLLKSGSLLLTGLTQLAVALGLMLAYSPTLTLVFLGTTPLYAGLMWLSRRRLRPVFAELEEGLGRYDSTQIDALKGIETVKAIGAEAGFRRRMLSQFHSLGDLMFRSNLRVMGYDAAVQCVGIATSIVFIWVGAYQVMAGDITLGALVAFNALFSFANAPLGQALALWDEYQSSSVLLDRLDDVMTSEPEQGGSAELRPVPSLEGGVAVRGLGFRYGGSEGTPILREVSFEARPGEFLAVVGRSGSGKSTLLKCLAGLLEPSEGSVLYDGIDARQLDLRDLRRRIGSVPQETYLFDDTIAGNIAFGEEAPDQSRILWAARAARVSEFVDALPLGFETRVGESGVQLSGGQRQRIALARALYRRPPILFLDEATSALDAETELAVQEQLEKALEHCTRIVVAHRMSTVRRADRILVLDEGRIVESGSHAELLERRGLYHHLCAQQIGV